MKIPRCIYCGKIVDEDTPQFRFMRVSLHCPDNTTIMQYYCDEHYGEIEYSLLPD